MSTQRIRRRGSDGHDRILDVDLGPGSASLSGSIRGSAMGDMQPIMRESAASLKGLAVAGSWRETRRFVILGQRRQAMRWQGTGSKASGTGPHHPPSRGRKAPPIPSAAATAARRPSARTR